MKCLGRAVSSVLALVAGAAAAQTGFPDHDEALRRELGGALRARPEGFEPRTRHLDGEGRPLYTNRLILEASPYLQQHAHNPVDWYPWGEEALAKAAAEGKPIFLSIGYSTCHWCHVMEEESFDDLAIAGILNQHFVAVKVDREQRPDLDEIYMTAVHVMGQRGGWPMSSFLTPDGRPFFGATYFPPDAFTRVLEGVARAWSDDRDRLLQVAANVVDRVRILTTARGEAEQIGEVEVEAAIERLLALEDDRWGGIGEAPKFPHESDLLLAADRALRTADARLVGFVDRALDAMARGGIFDQVGGGFHRYATDAAWRVPHFEKMLYNQALLARVYLAGYRLTGRPSFLRVARQTLDYVLAEMTAPDGAFYSATDADSEGEEGRYFLWTPAELSRVLGEEEGAWAAVLFGATDEGHLEGRSVLHLPRPLAEVAVADGVSEEELLARVDRVRRRLYAARSRREPPLRDDKVVTAWNGLMVAALAEASTVLGERYADAAARAADALWAGSRQPDGRLFRIRLDGEASVAGLLEDYAYLAEGLVALYDAAGDERWLERAVELSETMRRDFWDQEHGGFFVTAAAGAETLITRPRSPRDGALPSANSVALRVLLQAWRRDGSPALRTRADALVRSFSGAIASSPPSFPYLLLAWAERDELQVGPHAYAARGRVTARVRLEPGGAGPVWGLDLRIADGWHINSNAPLQDELVATAFESAGDGWEPVVVAYPPGHLESLGFQNEPLSVYSGELTLSGGLRRQAADADPVTTLRLRLQACDDRACLRPELLEIRLPLASALGTDAAWPAEASNSDSGARPAPLN